jgi:glycosyltransferase involved in cell wall biosynthesis
MQPEINSKPKVSVIMPVYNEESYLDLAINSVRNQLLKDIEIICVNDGSTDSSIDIINRHALEDHRIIVIDKENTGYGNSMNVGMAKATGEYVGVVETDDFILPDMFTTLYATAKEHDLDLIKSDHYTFVETFDGKTIKNYTPLTTNKFYYNRVINPQEELGVFTLSMMTWSGIYRRTFLECNRIKHNETPGASYQDNGFWFQVFTQAEKAYFIDKAFYMLRRDNPNSSVRSKNKVNAMSVEYDFIGKFLLTSGRMDKYKHIYQYHRCMAYHFTLNRISRELIYDYLHKFSHDFKEPLNQGILRQEEFNSRRWKNTKEIIEDPDGFYCKTYYNPRHDTDKSKDLTLRYYKIISNESKNKLDNIEKSASYKIGRFFTYIPRKIQNFKTIFGRGKISSVKTKMFNYALGNPDRDLKVLFIPSDNDAYSGAFLSMSVLGDCLTLNHKTQVEVVLPREGTGKKVLDEFSIKNITIPSFDWIVNIDKPRNKSFYAKKRKEHIWNFASAVRIGYKALKEDFDIIHINTTYTYVGALAAKFSKKPVVWHLREFLEEDQKKEIWCKEKGLGLIRESDAIIAVSNAIYDKYEPLFGNKLVRIYNGIDVREFYAPDKTILSGNPPTFIFVGRMYASKGCYFLIDALEKYAIEKSDEFKVIFVGHGDSKFESRINESPISDNIVYVGHQRDTSRYYQESDIAFTCSESEAFGRITVEAMLSGCLVIGTDSGGTGEIISDKETGLLYKGGDLDSIVEAIDIALTDPFFSQKMAAAGRAHAVKHFNAEMNADGVSEVYSKIEIRKKSKFRTTLAVAIAYPAYFTSVLAQTLYMSMNRIKNTGKK